jgi:hypothetical protein
MRPAHWRVLPGAETPARALRSLDRKAYNALPEFITVRETRVRVEQPGFRTKFVVVVTTLLTPEQASKEELATLYRARWNNELDLRSIKITMQMDMLRCMRPEQVRKDADRPDRFEPRMTKRRPKNYDRLTRPRKEIKREMTKHFTKI